MGKHDGGRHEKAVAAARDAANRRKAIAQQRKDAKNAINFARKSPFFPK